MADVKKLSPKQMAKRNERIVTLASSGKHSVAQIATKVGLSASRVRKIIKASQTA